MPTVSSQNYTGLYGAGGTVTPGTAYGNANVVGLLSAGSDGANTVSNIVATGNVSASYFLGNGSQLSGLPETYTNANVAAFLPTYTGNLSANTISATGNIVTDGFFVGNFQGNITGNLTVPGLNTQVLYNNSGNAGASADFTFNDSTNLLSVAGNVQANYFVGNGALLTGVATTLPSGTTDQYLRYNGSAWVAATLNLENDPSPGLGGDLGAANFNIANAANIQANGTFIGSGDGLSNINGANINGTVSSAVFAGTAAVANVANSVAGANVTGVVAQAAQANTANTATTAGSATTAGTVTTAAQANITSVGTLTSLSASGNITTSGNISGNFILGNGSLLTGIAASYGNTEVAAFLPTYTGAMTAMTGNITTTANVQGAYLIGDGSFITNLPGGSYGNANVAAYLPTFTGNLSAGNASVTGSVSAGGGVRTGAVLGPGGGAVVVAGKNLSDVSTAYFAADGPTGNATIQSYPGTGNVVSEWTFDPTGNITLPGPATSGGNIAAIVAGNAVVRLDNVTGNITAGNIVINQNQITTVGVQVSTPTTAISNARIVMGTGYNGNIGTFADTSGSGPRVRNSRLAVWDSGLTGNSATQSELSVLNQLEITSNIANLLTRINATTVTLQMGGGSAANVVTTNNPLATVAAQNSFLVGTSGNAAVGNTTIAQPIATGSSISVSPGGNANSAVAHQSTMFNLGGNITNAVMYSASTTRTTGTAVATNVAVYYVPPFAGNSLAGGSIGAGFRTATTYYGLRVDDNLAQAKLGSLRQYHEFEYQIPTTSGNVVIDKTNGQVQVLNLTGNVTITDYTNFVSTAYVDGTTTEPWQADTVTIVINQGTTGGYTVTLPTNNVTNGQTLYANGIKTVSTVANSVSLISVTASRLYPTGGQPAGRSDTAYLTTVSPAFTVA